jgi:hypothetical protein
MHNNQAACEAEIMQFITHDNGQFLAKHLQKTIDFIIQNIAEADEELIRETLPQINYLKMLLFDYNNEGTLFISE